MKKRNYSRSRNSVYASSTPSCTLIRFVLFTALDRQSTSVVVIFCPLYYKFNTKLEFAYFCILYRHLSYGNLSCPYDSVQTTDTAKRRGTARFRSFIPKRCCTLILVQTVAPLHRRSQKNLPQNNSI